MEKFDFQPQEALFFLESQKIESHKTDALAAGGKQTLAADRRAAHQAHTEHTEEEQAELKRTEAEAKLEEEEVRECGRAAAGPADDEAALVMQVRELAYTPLARLLHASYTLLTRLSGGVCDAGARPMNK